MPERPSWLSDELAPETIVCVDCGGTCHLISHVDEEDPPQPGDILVYRCSDCLDRWDLEIPYDVGDDKRR